MTMRYHLKLDGFRPGETPELSLPMTVKAAPMFTVHCSDCDATLHDEESNRPALLTLDELGNLTDLSYRVFGTGWSLGWGSRALMCGECFVKVYKMEDGS